MSSASRSRIKVRFLGGVADGENLTGSCTYLEITIAKNITRILVDTGLWQGPHAQSYAKNSSLKVDFAKIDAIVLTHSHVDHIGRYPWFFSQGFRGSVYCTEPTSRISSIMLYDTARVMSLESGYRLKKEKRGEFTINGNNKSKDRNKDKETKKNREGSRNDCRLLFTEEDVTRSLPLIKNGGYEYRRWIKVGKGISLKFYPSGHVLGGAICVFRIDHGPSNKYVYLGFSGDLGRRDGIILPPPEVPNEKMDFWFVESTYGGVCHPKREDELERMFQIIRDAVEKKKRVIIPSFALERTQELLYLLSYHLQKGTIPRIPIYLDAPMAREITKVFRDYWKTQMFRDQGMLVDFNPFNAGENPFLAIVEKETESVSLSKSPGPYILIAGSGMCDAGRVRNHLRENLSKHDTVVCLIGYMTPKSLGKRLSDGFPIVTMNGSDVKVNARIEKFQSFSGHADGDFIVDYTLSVIDRNRPSGKSVFILHGEAMSAAWVKNDLAKVLGREWLENISIPELNESIRIL